MRISSAVIAISRPVQSVAGSESLAFGQNFDRRWHSSLTLRLTVEI